jgi:hypothetical protein
LHMAGLYSAHPDGSEWAESQKVIEAY